VRRRTSEVRWAGSHRARAKRERYDALKKDFDAARADYRVIEYPGAVHAFTNPEATELGKKFNLPLRYDAKVDQEAMAEAAKFFAADLQK
jgi:dienelactone hydrolase